MNNPYRIDGCTRFETPDGVHDDAWHGFAIETRDRLYEVRRYDTRGFRYFVNSRPVERLPVTPLTRKLLDVADGFFKALQEGKRAL
jgi:hypothetical protein